TLGVGPQSVQGLQTSPARSAGQAVAILTDALNQLTTYTLDTVGRLTGLQTPDGATQAWRRDFAGPALAYTHALNHTTSYTYQYGPGRGDETQVTYPDGTTTRYQYDPTFQEVTQVQDALGRLTTYTYDPANGDLLTARDALDDVTTYDWSDGLLQSVT